MNATPHSDIDTAVPELLTLEGRLRAFFREVLASRRITSTRLAEVAGIHRTTLSRWIHGHISISLSTLDQLASVIGTEPLLDALCREDGLRQSA